MKHLMRCMCIVIGITSSQLNTQRNPIELTDTLMNVIKKLDGILLGADDVAQMMRVRRGTIEILAGKHLRAKNKRLGKYELDGKHYTLKQLAQLEQRIHDLLASNKLTSEQKQGLLQKEHGLKKCLNQGKMDFIKTTEPFLDQATKVKSLILPLITEWSQKRGRTNSILLEWSRTHENVLDEFYRLVTNCRKLAEFCEDLDDFLATFVHNCPRAYELFKIKYVQGNQ